MSSAVIFVWPSRSTTTKRRADHIAQMMRAVEAGDDTVVAVFTAAPGASMQEALERFRLMLRVVQDPKNAIAKLVVPSLDCVPNTIETLSELTALVKKSRLILVVEDLGVEATTAQDVEELRDRHGRKSVRKQKKSDSVKQGMRYAVEQREVKP
jgi:hypothetical protein